MSLLRPAHTVWLQRRAAVLQGTSADAGAESPDPARAAVLYRVAEKVSAAIEDAAALSLTATERTTLITEAQALTDRASHELRRSPNWNLPRAEEWVMTARALREILEAAR